MAVFRLLDRRPFLVPLLTFVIVGIGIVGWTRLSTSPVLLDGVPIVVRSRLYASVAGSSSALLGFTLAAVAILVALPGRASPAITRARETLVQVLLVTALFLLLSLISSTLALVVDQSVAGRFAVQTLTLAALSASLAGLLVGGAAFALAVTEAQQDPRTAATAG